MRAGSYCEVPAEDTLGRGIGERWLAALALLQLEATGGQDMLLLWSSLQLSPASYICRLGRKSNFCEQANDLE